MERSELVGSILMRLGGIKRLMQGMQYPCKDGETLTGAHVSVLFVIKHTASAQSHVIAERLNMTPGGVSQLVERLITDGLIIKQPSTHDRRSFDLTLSKDGEEFIRNIAKKHHALIEKSTAEFSDQDLTALLAMLDKISGALQEDKTEEK